MKLVASAKLRKAQKAIEGMRPYERTLAEILAAVGAGGASSTPTHASPVPSFAAEKAEPMLPDGEGSGAAGFVAPNPVSAKAESEDGSRDAGTSGRSAATAIVAIASNSSLCGGFNANVVKKALEAIRACEGEVEVYPIGRKMAEALRRAGYPADRDYNDLIGHPAFDKSAALARSLAERFERGELSRVVLVYNRFASASRQEPVAETWLPFGEILRFAQDDRNLAADDVEYILEPDAVTLVSRLLPQVTMLKFHAAILDSAAAEQAARTIAMQTATDNAEDLLGELTLEYNKGRQQKITGEILDLIGGAAE